MRMIALLAALSAAAPGGEAPRAPFFSKDVDFFGVKPRPKAPPAPAWDGERPPPAPVRDLLASPSPETARRYLDWQQSRIEQLRKAVEAVEAARAAEAPPGILYFTQPGCGYCAIQDRLLGDLPVRRIGPGEEAELRAKYRVDATPTIVAGGRVFRGVTPRATIEKAVAK